MVDRVALRSAASSRRRARMEDVTNESFRVGIVLLVQAFGEAQHERRSLNKAADSERWRRETHPEIGS
jgi:hypothetical protein